MEIGGPISIFKMKGRVESGYQYVGEASNLEFVQDLSYDFLLSSYCIEHLAKPIQSLLG
ncbi:hypothetical protein SFB21_0298 [Acinetobacter bouvetii]|uniref:Methyltransferase domain-containing protein n=1 Tax=Acinetobacter bouvetii TaxID=202951 RepID=A0A811G7B4_9GAMM|nr:hypothetical protein SFB21_0298 [Acinetobacter bouvetii]